MRDGNLLLSKLLSNMKEVIPSCPECDSKMRNLGKRRKHIVSLLGDSTITRNYYECEKCGYHSIPKDKLLDIENTSFTQGVRRVAAKLAACDSFQNSSAAMAELCGIYVCGKDTERIAQTAGLALETEKQAQIEAVFSMDGINRAVESVPVMYIEYDGTGVPVMKREVANRKGKQSDGTAKTREVKLGCIFTQTGTNIEGSPIRDENSTSYFGAIEASDSFSKRLFMEAANRGVDSAQKVVIIGDGAKWIWNLANDNFPNAIQIVDVFHAKEHLSELIHELFLDADMQARIKNDWFALLDGGDIPKLTFEMGAVITSEEKETLLQREITYFTENASRMQYASFKKMGLFIGSGVIEAGCKNVIGKRFKQSGMHWSVRGANAIIALRCALLSGNSHLLSHMSMAA